MATPRVYDNLLSWHLASDRQMAFISGPRQVGKTTVGRQGADAYINWDDVEDRQLVLDGPRRVAEVLKLDRLAGAPPVVLFDELHKYPRWKQFLKGFFDTYGARVRVAVTASSRLDIYRRGGDSLMGRYFAYRMHPFSVAEVVTQTLPPDRVLREPTPLADEDFEALWRFGGFPEPYLRRDVRFERRWRSLRLRQLVREDIRDLTQIQHLDQLDSMVRLLIEQSGTQLVLKNVANHARVTIDTVRRWVATLSDLHLGFVVRPWFRNVSRSLRKEPKWYVRDWAAVADPGRRAETFVAAHLLKAVEGWTDLGLGDFELGYLRDKEKREVDFVVVRDGEPWFLAEAKADDAPASPALAYFQRQLDAPFAFQVTVRQAYVPRNCFASPGPPLVVPARTFLSQLL
ncbi:MAG: ATP-binding protein [Gammaproteobacteria bacterium]|nr:ATP-binding protein [Gammaproteobacteria bacterium]